MSEQESDESKLYVACPKCVSFASTTSVEAGEETASSHNISRHDGVNFARTIDVHNEDDLEEFIQTAKVQAPGDEYSNLIRRLWRGNAPFFFPAKMFRKVVPEEDRQY